MRARNGAAMLACGAAAVIALTGCSSGGSGSTSTGGTSTTAPAQGSDAPSWASALGSGVTVTPPGTAPEGNDSPGSVMTDVADGLNQKNPTLLCGALPPNSQSSCRSGYKSFTKTELNSRLGSISNFKIGYIVVDGTQAVAGDTGRECGPENTKCFSNSDPAALFKANKQPFANFWKTVISASNGSTTYTLTPLSEVNGKWYLYVPASSS